jgi:acyl-CoA synthetase (AMP-forming)/AMP-acid ligase II
MSEPSVPETFNLADIWEAAADRCGDRPAVICGDRRLTYDDLEARANRLADHLLARGVEPGQHLGLYLENGSEYLEGMLAAYKVRAVPINVNFRYVEHELLHLFDDADLVGVVHHQKFSSLVASVAPSLPQLGWALSVADGSGEQPPAGDLDTTDYETALAASDPTRSFGPRRSDDAYVIYTGGTTGFPKGVVWHQEDAFYACIGGGDPMRMHGPVDRPAELVDRIIDGTFLFLPVAPLMHAAAQWTSLSWLFAGGAVVLMPGSLDARAIWEAVEREKINLLVIVGDAVARPLVDEWDRSGPYDISSLFSIGSGGAPLTPKLKDRLVEIAAPAMVNDGFGSSETGAQGTQRLQDGEKSGGVTRFTPYGNTTVVDETTFDPVVAGSGAMGRVALRGHIPQGYYNDAAKTAETFVEVDGERLVLTGDMATVEDDGTIVLLGRGSGCINTGGEKVFPEEVEAVLKTDARVYDALVVGVADDRWGQRVVAVVQPVAGASPTLDELVAHCRLDLAGYKVPRQLVVVDEVQRSPVGKPDYRWAKQVSEDADRAATAGKNP